MRSARRNLPEFHELRLAVVECHAIFDGGTNLSSASFRNTTIATGASILFDNVNLADADFRFFHLENSAQATFHDVNISDSSFRDLTVGAGGAGAELLFDDVNLENSSFPDLVIDRDGRVVFTSIPRNDAEPRHTNLKGSDWECVGNEVMHGIVFGRVDLTDSNITLRQLALAAEISSECILPEGITHAAIAETKRGLSRTGAARNIEGLIRQSPPAGLNADK